MFYGYPLELAIQRFSGSIILDTGKKYLPRIEDENLRNYFNKEILEKCKSKDKFDRYLTRAYLIDLKNYLDKKELPGMICIIKEFTVTGFKVIRREIVNGYFDYKEDFIDADSIENLGEIKKVEKICNVEEIFFKSGGPE